MPLPLRRHASPQNSDCYRFPVASIKFQHIVPKAVQISLRTLFSHAAQQELPKPSHVFGLSKDQLAGMWLYLPRLGSYMKKQNSGKIVNISLASIFSGRGIRIHYVTSKAGVLVFSRTLAREFGRFGNHRNTLTPGSTLNGLQDNAEAVELKQSGVAARCLKRVQIPEDLLGALMFLLLQ